MPYITALKAIAGLAILITWNIAVYKLGYNQRDQLATIADQKQQIETAALNKKVSEEQAKNSAYALFIESHVNDQINEINRLNGDLHTALSMPTKRKICQSGVPKTGDPENIIDTTDGTRFSREFEDFLESEKQRIKVELAISRGRYDYLMHLCNTGQAVCPQTRK